MTSRLTGHVHDCTAPLSKYMIAILDSHRDHNCSAKKSLEDYETIRACDTNSSCPYYRYLIYVQEEFGYEPVLYDPDTHFETLEQILDNIYMLLNEWYCKHMSEKELNINFSTGNGANTHLLTVCVNYRESENKVSEAVTYRVNTITTVDTFLKNICSSAGWIYKWRLQLIHNGHELRKTATFAEYDIQDNACLVITQEDIQIPPAILDTIRNTNYSTQKHIIQVHIRLLTGAMIPIFLSPVEDVMQLKYRIYDYCGVYVQHQRLIHLGGEMQDDRKLSDYNVQHNSTIEMMTRRKGYQYKQLMFSTRTEELRNNVSEQVWSFGKALQEVRESYQVASLEIKLGALINLKHKIVGFHDAGETCGIHVNYLLLFIRLLKTKIKNYEKQIKSLDEANC